MESIKLYFEGDDYCADFFKNYVQHTESDFKNCDFVISSSFESGNANRSDIQNQLNLYKNYSKRVIAFLVSDYNNKLDVPQNVLLFRTSLYKSLKKDNEFVLPYLWDYFTDDFKSIEKTDLPTVGFCGNVKKNSGLRLSSLNKIIAEKKIKTNFITKLNFGGGKPELVPDFKENILKSHFTLSNRGKGNFSIRFYQVLSLGRIPVLIDTDMFFPFENQIKWDTLIIRSKSQKEMIQKINYWWEIYNNEAFKQIQLNCKNTFDEYFTFSGFGNKMNSFLNHQKQNPIKI